jgi:murein DD-endopeptidase MepM/ murein hydrolase activator NlpD
MRPSMRRAAVLLATTILLAACGSPGAPSSDGSDSARSRASDLVLAPETTLVRGVVPPNTTLNAMLRAQGLADDVVDHIVAAARTVFDPHRLRSLQPFSLEKTMAGALRSFEYEVDANTFLRVSATNPDASDVHAELVPIPKTLEYATIAGSISEETPSLFQAVEASGERIDLALALADVFASDIDFNTDLQPGDRFTVTFERFRREGRPDSYGYITAAELRNDGRVFRAFRFTPLGGKAAYYDEQGRAVRRFFLKSPLKFTPRITSGFSTSRMHPILHVARAHRGVDYAAPIGAPVVAVANGTVVSATYDSANGRMVRLRHASGYQSYYLHLSKFTAGIHAGVRVAQGDTIGFVGMTGLATGPHLHFGLTRNGVFINPLRERQNTPPGEPLPASAMEAFRASRDQAIATLAAASDHATSATVPQHAQR